MKNLLPVSNTPFFSVFGYIPGLYRVCTTSQWSVFTPVPPVSAPVPPEFSLKNTSRDEKTMTEISIPNSVTHACNRLSDQEIAIAALNRFMKSSDFSEAIFEHKKQFPNTGLDEYTAALKILLSHYKAGQPVNANELLNQTSEALDSLKDRTISRNNLRDSFVPLLKKVGIVEGDKPLLWAHLDTRTQPEIMWSNLLNLYRGYMQKTEGEAQFELEQRNKKYLKKAAVLVDENKTLQEDIRHTLDYLKKEDKKCRDLAYELGVPYSQVKEDMKNKQKSKKSNAKLRNTVFLSLVAAVMVTGLFFGDRHPENPSYASDPMGEEIAIPSYPGLTHEESIWRHRYIELFKQYGTITQSTQDELVALSGEFMIPVTRLNEIIQGIKPEEVK